MIYSHTIFCENGDTKTPVIIYSCNICDEKIVEMSPYGEINKKHICTNCMIEITEDLVSGKGYGFGGSLVMEYWLLNLISSHLHSNRSIRKNIHPSVRKKLLIDKAFCIYCLSNKNLQIDHIKPVSKGGKNDLKNLQILCRNCNLKKGNKFPYKPKCN